MVWILAVNYTHNFNYRLLFGCKTDNYSIVNNGKENLLILRKADFNPNNFELDCST